MNESIGGSICTVEKRKTELTESLHRWSPRLLSPQRVPGPRILATSVSGAEAKPVT